MRQFLFFTFLHVGDEFLKSRRDRNGKKDAEKARELAAGEEGKDDEERRHADNLFHDQGIDEVRLKLMEDDETTGYQKNSRCRLR